MTVKYSNFTESFDKLIEKLGEIERPSGPNERKKLYEVHESLIYIWGEIEQSVLEKKISFRGNSYPIRLIIRDFRMNFPNFLSNLENNEDYRVLKENLNFDSNYLSKVSNYTLYFMNALINNGNEEKITLLKEELVNIFFRLTQYPPNSFVPLIDLIREKFAYHFYNHHSTDNQAIENMVKEYKFSLEGIFYTLIKMNAVFPAPYYYKLGVFERTDQLNQSLRELESSFKSYSNEKI